MIEKERVLEFSSDIWDKSFYKNAKLSKIKNSFYVIFEFSRGAFIKHSMEIFQYFLYDEPKK